MDSMHISEMDLHVAEISKDFLTLGAFVRPFINGIGGPLDIDIGTLSGPNNGPIDSREVDIFLMIDLFAHLVYILMMEL